MEYQILNQIRSPEDVKKLNNEQLDLLCAEARDCIINTVSKNGGHLASNLGSVELTIALHRAFSSPKDAILFDVGHQCYTHKLLTGRFDRFNTIRTTGGLSGFMRPDESEHDPFVTGHSSNSISAAYGIYKAKRILGQEGSAVAIIGDGALTGGMAYEALNNAGEEDGNFIVVLNDNEMSISQNVGSVARAITRLRNRPRYHRFKADLSYLLRHIPLVGNPLFKLLDKFKGLMKSLVYRHNAFTALGYNYLGPVDGHNIHETEELLRIAAGYKRPCLVHVITTKGKGYIHAENSPKNYHGVAPFNMDVGATPSQKITYSDIAGQTLCELAQNDNKICAITAAMISGTGLQEFSEKFADRFFDVGIAEQHAVTFAAGLAKGGIKPFFAVYSSFLQRGYDQIVHDAAIAHLPIKLLVDRAGIVGEDGESHQGLFDVSFLTSIPGVTVYSPCTYDELSQLIEKTAQDDELCAIRYPRGCEKELSEEYDFSGDFTLVKRGGKRLLVTYGRLFFNAVKADIGNVDIIKLNRIYPIADEIIQQLCEYEEIHFFEESVLSGGIAEHVSALLFKKGYMGKYEVHAIDNIFVPASDVDTALKNFGLDTASMENAFGGEFK